MGKRSNFERVERDFYPTPLSAVIPLVHHLPRIKFTYIEPCAGDGALISHLSETSTGECVASLDIEPQKKGITKADALNFDLSIYDTNYIITNPPWNRKILHPMIETFSKDFKVWLLFDADWSHTQQAAPYMKYCSKIVSVGRVKWIPGSASQGKDNCAWYLFDKNSIAQTKFYSKVEKI